MLGDVFKMEQSRPEKTQAFNAIIQPWLLKPTGTTAR